MRKVPVPSTWHSEVAASRHCPQHSPVDRGSAATPALARNHCMQQRAANSHTCHLRLTITQCSEL